MPRKSGRKARSAPPKPRPSRDELYAREVEKHLKKLRAQDITAKLNRFFDENPDLNQIDPFVEAAAVEVLRRTEW